MKILIADDEPVERTALCEILKEEPGIEILETCDGQETLDALCDGLNPDLCLIDIRMPIVDGLELMKRIRREPSLRHLKVVITSANRDRNVILALAQLAISGYLLKPYDPAKVLAVLRPLINSVVAQKTTVQAPPSINLLAKTLLVVDDDKDVRDLLVSVAKMEADWDVVEASNGEEALLLLKQGLKPSLCFCDLMMPKLDGYGFVKRLREDTMFQNLPVVIISSEHKASGVRQLAEQKIAGFIVKPFDVTKIRAIMRQLVKSSAPEGKEEGAGETAQKDAQEDLGVSAQAGDKPTPAAEAKPSPDVAPQSPALPSAKETETK